MYNNFTISFALRCLYGVGFVLAVPTIVNEFDQTFTFSCSTGMVLLGLIYFCSIHPSTKNNKPFHNDEFLKFEVLYCRIKP